MTNSSTILIITGVGVALLALLFLMGPSPEPASQQSVQQDSTTTTGSASYYTLAPVVDAGPDRTVGERETFQLAGTGYDPNGLPVTYTWTMQGGVGFFSNAHSPTTMFTAPSACDCNEVALLTLTVTNSAGLRSSDQMTVTIRDPLACPASTCESSGFRVVVPQDRCASSAASTTCPPTPSTPCDSPCITEVSPNAGCAQTAVPCPCANQDSGCWSSWQPAWPLDEAAVAPKDRAQPSIDRHFPAQMNESGAVALRGHIRNPACQSVCFTWSADKGWLEDADTLTPTYHAPASDRLNGETVSISLIAHDSAGNRSYDQIRIKIRNTDPG
jgi:hypothetical protein